MLAVNLGTRGPAAAAATWWRTRTSPRGRRPAIAVRRTVTPTPHGVRVWCLGNEMDGPWQIGARTAPEYARLAREAAVAMRAVDPTVELVACGSSGLHMSTFGAWERTVLDVAGDTIDHLSLHHYVDRSRWSSVEGYLASSRELDTLLDTVGAIVDEAAAAAGSQRRIGLSVDEWNVWRITEHEDRVAALPPDAIHEVPPALAEDTHDLTDALVVGCLLISLLRHADRVRIACVAQLVNVIPLIRTVDGGPAWRQTTAHVFAMAARSARGVVLRLDLDGPMLTVPDEGRRPGHRGDRDPRRRRRAPDDPGRQPVDPSAGARTRRPPVRPGARRGRGQPRRSGSRPRPTAPSRRTGSCPGR